MTGTGRTRALLCPYLEVFAALAWLTSCHGHSTSDGLDAAPVDVASAWDGAVADASRDGAVWDGAGHHGEEADAAFSRDAAFPQDGASGPDAALLEPRWCFLPDTAPEGYKIWDVFFLNPDHGIFVGGPDYDLPSQNGVYNFVMRTRDGGQTFHVSTNLSQGFLSGVACSSGTHCWISGRFGTILYTTDGGATWQQATLEPAYGRYLYSVAVVQGTTVLVTGTDSTLFRSTDGAHFVQVPQGDVGGHVVISEIDCPTAQTCYGAGNGKTFFASSDGGLHWTRSWPGFGHLCTDDQGNQRACDLYGLSFPASDTGWVVDTGGSIGVTRDAGGTWDTQLDTGNVLNDVDMVDTQNGWAVGNGGVILHTVDGGATWIPEVPDNGALSSDVIAVDAADAQHAWAATRDGRILKYASQVCP